MATRVQTGNFIELTVIAADVEPSDIFTNDQEHKIKRIEFVAGANNDILVVKQGSATGATIVTLATPDVEIVDRVFFDDGGQWMLPYIDFSDCTLTADHKVVIELA